MNGYVLRRGDLLIGHNNQAAVVTKTTQKYVYYFLDGHCDCKVKKELVWQHYDKSGDIFDIKFGNMTRRKKQRKMRTLDLHGVSHKDVDERVRKFLNFIELPCRIITGNSPEMKKIVEHVVKEYNWTTYEQDGFNTGTLMVVER